MKETKNNERWIHFRLNKKPAERYATCALAVERQETQSSVFDLSFESNRKEKVNSGAVTKQQDITFNPRENWLKWHARHENRKHMRDIKTRKSSSNTLIAIIQTHDFTIVVVKNILLLI